MQKKYYDGFAVQRIIFDNTDGELMLKLLQAFADEPSAKVIEPKRGKWIPNSPFTGNCSECGGKGNLKDNYCSTCGAEMDRSEE